MRRLLGSLITVFGIGAVLVVAPRAEAQPQFSGVGGFGMSNTFATERFEPQSLQLGAEFGWEFTPITILIGIDLNVLTASQGESGSLQFAYLGTRLHFYPHVDLFVDLKAGPTWLAGSGTEFKLGAGFGVGFGYRWTLSPMVDISPRIGVRLLPIEENQPAQNQLFGELGLVLTLNFF